MLQLIPTCHGRRNLPGWCFVGSLEGFHSGCPQYLHGDQCNVIADHHQEIADLHLDSS